MFPVLPQLMNNKLQIASSSQEICTKHHFLLNCVAQQKLSCVIYFLNTYLCTTCRCMSSQFSLSPSLPRAGLISRKRTPATFTPDQTATIKIKRILKNFLNEQKFQLKSVILNNMEGRKKGSFVLKN